MESANIILLPVTAITNADIVSRAQQIDFMSGYSVQAIWTGAAIVATVKLQASLDYNPGGVASSQPINAGTWDDIVGSTQTVNGPGSWMYNVWPAMYPYFRIYFTYSSGTGTVFALTRIKGG